MPAGWGIPGANALYGNFRAECNRQFADTAFSTFPAHHTGQRTSASGGLLNGSKGKFCRIEPVARPQAGNKRDFPQLALLCQIKLCCYGVNGVDDKIRVKGKQFFTVFRKLEGKCCPGIDRGKPAFCRIDFFLTDGILCGKQLSV